jgi:nucleoside-diphosphate-sugar epimerase
METRNRALALVRQDAQEAITAEVAKLGALRQSHVFISGGSGFLGAWLLELIQVLNAEHDFGMRVTVFSRNAREFAQRWPHLGQLAWAKFQDGDIRYLGELPRDADYVIHAAALTDRRLFASQPTMVAETNTAGTLRLLRAANLLEGVRKFLLLSSGMVYGAQPWQQESVDETFVGPLPCHTVNAVYAESKRFAEVLGHCAVSETKLPLVTLRPFAFVGPYQSVSRVGPFASWEMERPCAASCMAVTLPPGSWPRWPTVGHGKLTMSVVPNRLIWGPWQA